MTVRVDVSDFDRFGRSLRAAARDVDGRVRKSMRESGGDVGPKMRDAGARAMPRRGGLAGIVQDAEVVVTERGGFGGDAKVEVGLSSHINLANLDRGTVYHPVFGNRGVWVAQAVPAGKFSQAARDEGPKVLRDRVGGAVADVIHSAATF